MASSLQSPTPFIQPTTVLIPQVYSSTPSTPASPQQTFGTVWISSNVSAIVSEVPEALVRDFNRDGAEELLGFDKDGLENDAKEEEWNMADDDHFKKSQTDTRVAAALRSEGNRRRGVIKTQELTVKIWKVSLAEEKASSMRDDIVDEHSPPVHRLVRGVTKNSIADANTFQVHESVLRRSKGAAQRANSIRIIDSTSRSGLTC